MKIGILSDTHIKEENEKLPSEIFTIFHGVDAIYHAGDLVHPSVIAMLSTIAPVHAVQGNMDNPDLKMNLPKTMIFSVLGKKIAMTHGFGPPWGLRERVGEQFISERPDVIIYGHSHAPEVMRSPDGTLFVNPGSPTDKVFTKVNSVAVMTVTEKGIDAQIKYL